MATLVRNGAWQGTLTPRQAEVLDLIAHGMTNQQIAEDCNVGLETIRQHAGGIYANLGLTQHGPCRSSHQRVLAARWWITHVEQPSTP